MEIVQDVVEEKEGEKEGEEEAEAAEKMNVYKERTYSEILINELSYLVLQSLSIFSLQTDNTHNHTIICMYTVNTVNLNTWIS